MTEALLPEPDRYLLTRPRLPVAPWKRHAYRVMTANAHRFDGRNDVIGRAGMRYLADCSSVLDVADGPETYALMITRMRWAAVTRYLARPTTKVAVPTIRRLHTLIIEAIEG